LISFVASSSPKVSRTMASIPGKNSKNPPALSPLELQVMDVVWQLGDCTSAQVIETFTERRRLAPTTIRTVLTNLRRKGYVKPLPTIERGFKLRPIVQREAVARRSVKDLLQSLFADAPQQAVAYLIEDADISAAELDQLSRLIEARKLKDETQ